jgi:hypothetical protein
MRNIFPPATIIQFVEATVTVQGGESAVITQMPNRVLSLNPHMYGCSREEFSEENKTTIPLGGSVLGNGTAMATPPGSFAGDLRTTITSPVQTQFTMGRGRGGGRDGNTYGGGGNIGRGRGRHQHNEHIGARGGRGGGNHNAAQYSEHATRFHHFGHRNKVPRHNHDMTSYNPKKMSEYMPNAQHGWEGSFRERTHDGSPDTPGGRSSSASHRSHNMHTNVDSWYDHGDSP